MSSQVHTISQSGEDKESKPVLEETDVDLYSYHEKRAGRLVVDPEYVFPLNVLDSCCIMLLQGGQDRIRRALCFYTQAICRRD